MEQRYTWKISQSKKPVSIKEAADQIAKRRGISDGSITPEPNLGLSQWGKAATVLQDAARKSLRIAIHGDYDVDGVTSALILGETLRSAGAQIVYLASGRRNEGYGLKSAAVGRIRASGPDVVVLADLGSNTPQTVEELGTKTIVIDHHRCDGFEFGYLLNPNCSMEQSGPDAKSMCSAALSYELMCTVDPKNTTNEQLALAALGTLADMSILKGYNHDLVRRGLQHIASTSRPGLKWMLQETHVYGRQLTGEEISWKIVPPLNSPGRIGDASTAIRSLSLRDESETTNAARKCWDMNNERKYITDQAYQYALDAANEKPDDRFVLVASSTFQRGVVGLIAGKLVRTLNKPVGVGAIEGDRCTFSFRSIPGIDLVDLVRQVPELKGAGGHGAASGGQCKAHDVSVIRSKLSELLEGVEVKRPELIIEFPYPANEIHMNDVSDIDLQLLPYGNGNPRPVFISRLCEVTSARKMSKGQRVAFKPRVGNEQEFSALSFDAVDLKRGQVVDLAYTAEISRWRGEAELCFMVKDARESEGK